MEVTERIKSLFRWQPPTAEEIAARADAESMRDQTHQNEAALKNQVQGRIRGSDGPF